MAKSELQRSSETIEPAADIIRSRSEHLSRLILLEMGKLIEESRAEVQLTADILSYYAKNAKTFLAQEQLKQQEGPTAVISQSIAICLAIQELINKRLVRTQAADSTNP